MNKKSKLSCCAVGGSWFGKCGNDGEYTRDEGFKACNSEAEAQYFATKQPMVVDQQNVTTNTIFAYVGEKFSDGYEVESASPKVVDGIANAGFSTTVLIMAICTSTC